MKPTQKDIEALKAQATQEEQRLVIKHRASNDLHFMNSQILRPKTGLGLGRVHKRIADFIQEDGKRKLLMVSRGHFKTTCVTEGYSLQRILKNPSIRILLVNVKLENAIGFLRKIRGHFDTNEEFRWLAREILPRKTDKWSEKEIIVRRDRQFQEATIEVIGVGGTLVSKHYDLIIYDDVVNDENTATKEQIDKLLDWWRASLSLLEPDGEVIVIGTVWHYSDLYAYIQEHFTDFKVLKIPCTVDGVSVDDATAVPAFPEKFTIEYLRQLRQEQGSYVFNAQYMLEPIDDTNAAFKREWIHYFEEEDLRGLDLKTYMTVDPAISLRDDSDNSAIVVTSIDEFNKVYVRETVYGHWTPNELIEKIFVLYNLWQPVRIGIEVVAFQKVLRYSLQDEMRKSGVFLPLVELRTDTHKSKEMRIRGLQPRFENNMVALKKNKMSELEDELIRFPLGRRDDILDALSYQTQLWTAPRGVFKKEGGEKKHHHRQGWGVINSLTGY